MRKPSQYTITDNPSNLAHVAAQAYLIRYQRHTLKVYEGDLKKFLIWCEDRGIDPIQATRPQIERYRHFLEDECELKPSTVARYISNVIGYYRFAAIDGHIQKSPAEYVTRPRVSTESQTLGLSHLQFEKFIVASRERPVDYALVSMIGLMGFRISEACNTNVQDLNNTHGHQTLSIMGKGGRPSLVPLPPAVGRAIGGVVGDRTEGPILRTRTGARMDRAAATRVVVRLGKKSHIPMRVHPHMLRHTYITTLLDCGVSLRDVQIAARHADTRSTIRYDRSRDNLDRHANYVLAAFVSDAR